MGVKGRETRVFRFLVPFVIQAASGLGQITVLPEPGQGVVDGFFQRTRGQP
jgi:hypothetical protein